MQDGGGGDLEGERQSVRAGRRGGDARRGRGEPGGEVGARRGGVGQLLLRHGQRLPLRRTQDERVRQGRRHARARQVPGHQVRRHPAACLAMDVNVTGFVGLLLPACELSVIHLERASRPGGCCLSCACLCCSLAPDPAGRPSLLVLFVCGTTLLQVFIRKKKKPLLQVVDLQ